MGIYSLLITYYSLLLLKSAFRSGEDVKSPLINLLNDAA